MRLQLDEAEFLRAALRGQVAHWPAWSDQQIDRFLFVVDQQGVAGLLHGGVRAGRCPGVAARAESQLAAATHKTAVQNRLRAESARRVFQALNSEGITYAILKGMALLADGYEHAGQRPMNDMDILVAPDEMERAARTLCTSGYLQEATDTPSVAHHWTFVPSDSSDRVDIIEVHRQLFVEAPFDVALDTDSLLSRRRWVRWGSEMRGGPASTDTYSWSHQQGTATGHVTDMPVLSLVDGLLHVAGHLVVQHAGGERLIWLADVDRLVRRGSLMDTFWTELLQRARDSGLDDALDQALYAAASWYGTDVPRQGAARQPRRAAPPRAARPSGARVWSDVAASTSWRRRFTLARSHLLPTPADMRAWYGIAHAWQLPWYYLRRWSRGVRDVVADSRAAPVPVRTPDQWFVEG